MKQTQRYFTRQQREAIKAAIDEKAMKKLLTHWSLSLVSHYKNCTKQVSPARAIVIETLCGIPVEIMRPDIFARNRKSA